jgi:hypothetical protein
MSRLCGILRDVDGQSLSPRSWAALMRSASVLALRERPPLRVLPETSRWPVLKTSHAPPGCPTRSGVHHAAVTRDAVTELFEFGNLVGGHRIEHLLLVGQNARLVVLPGTALDLGASRRCRQAQRSTGPKGDRGPPGIATGPFVLTRFGRSDRG